MSWLTVLKTIAPTVVAALGGPLAGAAVAAIGAAVGLDNPTKETIERTLLKGQLTPEAVARLQELELTYQDHERERGFRYAELEFKDKDSARQMQIATHSKMPAVLTVLVTLGFFGILTLLFFHPELKGNEIVMVMVGQLSAVWAGCVAFYTGTTYASASKNAVIANSNPK